MNVDTAKLRKFIQQFFNADELTIFLFDYFATVSDDVTPTMPKSQQIQMLLGFCTRHNKMPDLLAALHRERPNSFSPDDYVQGEKAPTSTPQSPAPITRNPRQIFISHAHQDAAVAQRLARDLEAHGFNIWIAPDSIRPGEKWVEAINRGLEESGIFVLLLSPDAVTSRWVQMETNVAITYTHEDEMQLYPLMLKACRLPALWRAFQHISLRGGYERGFDQLLAVLNQSEHVEPGFLVGQSDRPGAKTKDSSVEEPEEASEFVKRIRENVRKNLNKYELPEANADRWIHPKSGLGMVRVPAGEFLYGDDKKKLHLDEFWIAKTPVTNAEYKRFLDANPNYDVPFLDVDWVKSYNWNKQRRTFPAGKDNHPVVLVSWHDAKAYAEWAGLELPTEQQWEKAARGTDGRKYPWGNEWRDSHCNTKETGIGTTTPVGQFSPQGDSPYGCGDMSGNVWEWTSTLRESGSSWRVLRGGSWLGLQDLAWAASRFDYDPGDRSDLVGFRVVVRRPPSHDP